MKTDICFVDATDCRFLQALSVRYQVFVCEQGVAEELERDEIDAEARHVVVFADGQAIGTGRFFADQNEPEVARIGRVAVLRDFRQKKIGSMIIGSLLAAIRESHRFTTVRIHAQKQVEKVYSAFGFTAVGEEFLEAGIVHIEMHLHLDSRG
jgi:predicted GNAT family N-acyltransferase